MVDVTHYYMVHITHYTSTAIETSNKLKRKSFEISTSFPFVGGDIYQNLKEM